MKYKIETVVLNTASFSNRVSTLIHTLYQSKYFTSPVPKLQSLETNVILAIRPKKIISNILVSIPVTHENKLHVNYFAPSFPLHREHSDRQLLYNGFYSLKSYSSLYVVFKSVPFFNSFLCQFYVQSSVWTESFKQLHRKYLILDSNQIPLYFLLHFFFHILIFVPIYCSMVKNYENCKKKIP
jgi:hypothetical protein